MGVKEVFEEFVREYIEALNELEEEKLEEKVKELEEEVRERLRPLEVEFFVDSFARESFSAPPYHHYMNVDVHRVIDEENGKQYFVYVVYYHKQKPGRSEYALESVEVEEESLIDSERTPFTAKLVEEIPWLLIRDTWLPSIKKLVFEIAEMESRGELKDKLEEIAEKVRRNLWVYDYQHVFSALKRTAELFGLPLPEG